ncbi:MAG: 6-phosphogluconolactonase [Gloeomargarita sp. SKYBB_i_bin120]|nr:6-phosphogluconolactonase [Gloeomargarita sp. SKYG98]MCS7291739.1 6-phosphogluconolactonase [Gloeomargarita sp. SKYB120]MDW8177299.1 6-phosphogluconolactonase [Gloeomargarita sp. SKYBB_i_bin120]
MNRIVCADLEALSEQALRLLEQRIHSALAERGRATLALAGGSTPRRLYQRLAQQNWPWSQIHVFWGDERFVPPDHPDSNYRLARETWLDHVPMPAANIHPIPTVPLTPAAAAEAYERELQAFWGLQPGEFPVFDVILLGMGEDGHTASLFPHTAALQVCDRAVTVGYRGDQPRITLTVPTLNYGRCVLFLVAGVNKAAAYAQVTRPDADGNAYPAALIRPVNGELWWLVEATVLRPGEPEVRPSV